MPRPHLIAIHSISLGEKLDFLKLPDNSSIQASVRNIDNIEQIGTLLLL